MRILLTNDDGIDSPAIVPLANALSAIGDVTVVVPDSERSWIGKAITRVGDIVVAEHEVDGRSITTATGYPADCVQLGVFNLADEPPELVVSGINIGANYGSGFIIGSGTVGACFEASVCGLPALALSAHVDGEWDAWQRHMSSPASVPDWERLARVGAALAREIVDGGFPAEVDVLSANLPSAATIETPWRVGPLAHTGYGSVFQRRDGLTNVYQHDWVFDLVPRSPNDGTDMALLDEGVVTITPLRVRDLSPDVAVVNERFTRG